MKCRLRTAIAVKNGVIRTGLYFKQAALEKKSLESRKFRLATNLQIFYTFSNY